MTEETNTSSESKSDGNERYIFDYGKVMSRAKPGEEIVISGVSGVFPISNNINEFRDNLFNKNQMVLPNLRWNLNHPEIPECAGVLPEVDKYDVGFFGLHERQSHSFEAMARIVQEKVIEAIFDAGLHPSDLENTRTGVYMGVCFGESDKSWFFENLKSQSYAFTGSSRSMMAHRISYFLKLKGPSYTTDTACSSSLYAIEHAFRALRLGEIDYAIVGGTNLCLHPYVSLQFARLGVLSKDGSCKVFDKTGDGYARCEAIGAMLLQRSNNAKRIYCELMHAKTNCDGHKTQGITYPSGEAQTNLLTEFYDECGVDKYDLSYLEAHGTGTFVGDPEECSAIDSVLAKGRKTPLLIGSVKSNIGHSEPASGVCSIVKCIIGMETGYIPPNLHYTIPRDEIRGLHEGRLKVVTEKMPFEDNRGLIGINSFGFGGGNCHILLRWNPKEKVNGGTPEDNLPRLVCVSGRTEEAVTSLLDSVTANNVDVEYIKLVHEAFRKNVGNHVYRGYTTVSKSGEVARSIKHYSGNNKTLYFVFGELGNWRDIGNQLMGLPLFVKSMQRIQKLLLPKGINVSQILLNESSNKGTYHVVGSVAVQICIVDVLNELEIKPKFSYGYSFGELVSAYFTGILSLEDAVNCALVIDESATYVNDLSENNLGQEIHVVTGNCVENGSKLLNGTDVLMDKFKLILKTNNSGHIKEDLVRNLTNILGEVHSGTKSNKYRSADYFINAMTDNDLHKIHTTTLNSVIFKIGSGPIYDDMEDVISVATSGNKNHLVEFVNSLGSLYEQGYNPQIDKLYPSVKLPVSRGTPMISPYIKWMHNRKVFVPDYNVEVENIAHHGARVIKVQHTDLEWTYILGHVIDGRNLFPAAGYLFLVWETLAIVNARPMPTMQVVFENCKFIRATTMPNKGYIQFNVNIQKGTGAFEVISGDSAVVTGRIIEVTSESEEDMEIAQSAGLPESTAFPLKTKDVYKELRLRGYNYKGDFRAIQECDSTATTGYIKWAGNWVTFIDNMLQMKILQTDTRLLYIPTFLTKLVINAKTHLDWITENYTKTEKTPNLPVLSDATTGIIRSGGIKISGLIASSIARRKDLGIPVLESYKFVPNFATLDTEQSIRVNTQIILENALMYKVKAIEVIDEFTSKDAVHLTPIIQTVLQDQPLINPSLKILSSTPLDVEIEVENKKLTGETDCLIVIASNVLSRPEILKEAFESLKENGFIISRESPERTDYSNMCPDVTILTIHKTPTERLLLLQKSVTKHSKCIKITSSDDFSWVPIVQEVVKAKSDEEILLYSENEPNSGILGLVNCLRREPDTKNIKCMFIMDNAKQFNSEDSFYSDQIKKNMAVNVYKHGEWGTYRHLRFDEITEVESEHCFVNPIVRGDLSSLRWIEGPLRLNKPSTPERVIVQVHYAALNFRDVMTAVGKLNADVITQIRLEQECVQGFEFSGIDQRGFRVMGMVTHGALSSLIVADSYLLLNVPDSLTLEEAATIPVVYGTVISGFFMRAKLKRGESILVHSGTGGIGQAAIRLALYYGCKVYTTVGSAEKREFLKKTYPQLTDNQIGNSHDESFEQMIYKETNGRGVDIVLNSLAEEKLLASVRCLAKGGRFVEIGKYDMANNSQISLLLLQKEASFHGVMLDQYFTETPKAKSQIIKFMKEGLNNGAIKPLNTTTFKRDEIEQAFRLMATGKHMGKVLVQVRESEKEPVSSSPVQKFRGIARYFCEPEKTYVIAGGLGGFGLELADWLILRGARKIVLTSRTGMRTGYQNYRIRIWRSYGAIIKISNANITTEAGCKQLIEESQELGPIDAIFNLAVVLADSAFENQTPETFMTSFKPKAIATKHLDKLTRNMCPELSEFVIFSSVSCGRGNAGQTNYGMANSVMERICEKRKEDGYPALAIEWGAIGEVGLVAEMQEEHTELEISGTLQQKMSSCLKVLDTLLRQSNTIVSSMVVAEKRGGANSADNVVDAVINILGLNDSKSVSFHSTLAELGMDSITAVEIKQTLEREFEIFLSAKDMRTMTLAKLKELQAEKCDGNQSGEAKSVGFEAILRLIGEEYETNVTCVPVKSKVEENVTAPKVLLFPGIEGYAKAYELLSSHLHAHALCIQFRYEDQKETILEMAEALMPSVEEQLTKDKPFTILAYSYGVLVALEVVSMLESLGYTGTVICVDGAPAMTKEMLRNYKEGLTNDMYETALMCSLLAYYMPNEMILKQKENLFKCKTWEEKSIFAADLVKHRSVDKENHQKAVANGIYKRLNALDSYNPSYTKVKSTVRLYKPTQPSVPLPAEDYHLSEICENPVEFQVYEGNHVTILENELLAEAIDSYIQEINQS